MEFKKYPSLVRKNNFCSCICRGLWDRGKKVPWNRGLTKKVDTRINGRKKGEVKLVNCDYCGSYIERSKNSINKYNFCCSSHYHLWLLGRKHSSGTVEKRSLSHIGKKYERIKSKEEVHAIFSGIMGSKWQDQEYSSMMFEAQHRKPNKTETYMDTLVQKARSTDFIYSGDGKIWIEGRCPDWFNVNGKKQVIEFFGDYWHGEKRTGRTKEQEEGQRIDHFKKYGYDCLIIWEHELKEPDEVIEKIRRL